MNAPSGPPGRIRAVNHLLPQGLGRWRLSSAAALEDAARRSVGSVATGQPELSADCRVALQQLLASYAASAQLHPLGEIMTAVNLLSLLKNRLKLDASAAQSPGIAERSIKAPLVITGLPRTGSTLLHNLLALDPQLRVPGSWEVTYPAPLAASALTRRKRILATQARFRLIETLHPGFKAIHELDALLPQECLVITASAMRSHLFFSSAFVPDYQDWLDEQPGAPMYQAHRLLLQYLQGPQHVSQSTTWALKAPSHLFSLSGLLEAYPDCRLVYTQRDPQDVIGSIASLQWHLYRTFSNFADVKELGRQVCNRWGKAHQQFAARLAADSGLRNRCFTINYSNLVADPIASVQSLYEHFELILTPATKDAMHRYMRARPQHKHGAHNYSLADYGLNKAALQRAFGL